jgi:lipopolysaccharide export LptBFGC system permease protein LptF
MKTKLFFTLLLVLSAVLSVAQDNWIFVTISSKHELIYIRSKPVSRNQNRVKIWVKAENGEYEAIKNGEKVMVHNGTRQVLSEFDCKNNKSRTHQYIIYDSSGTTVESQHFTESDLTWVDIAPDSIYEAVINKVCELFQ